MIPQTIPGFDCLEFKRKVQSEIYEKTKNMTVEEEIAFFREAAETGPFAELLRAVRAAQFERERRRPSTRPASPQSQ